MSRATVSLVLRGSPLVNKLTRARVEEELRRQGYVYNRAAANLRQRSSSSIALILNDLANPFFAEFAAGVDEALGAAGFVTLLGCTDESPAREQAVLGSLLEHGPAASSCRRPNTARHRTCWRPSADARPCCCSIASWAATLPEFAHWDQLMLDNQHGARLATEHLIAAATGASRSSAAITTPARAGNAMPAMSKRCTRPACAPNRTGALNARPPGSTPPIAPARCSRPATSRPPRSATTTPSRWG